jgi:hypothetical protein
LPTSTGDCGLIGDTANAGSYLSTGGVEAGRRYAMGWIRTFLELPEREAVETIPPPLPGPPATETQQVVAKTAVATVTAVGVLAVVAVVVCALLAIVYAVGNY